MSKAKIQLIWEDILVFPLNNLCYSNSMYLTCIMLSFTNSYIPFSIAGTI